MSWLSDRTGIHINSINDITSGRALQQAIHNPLVDAGLALAIPGVGGAITGGIGKVAGLFGGTAAPGGAGAGNQPWTLGSTGLTLGDLLGFGGKTAAGIADYSQQEAARKQAAQQFAQQLDYLKTGQAQQYGLQKNSQAMLAQNQLNRAPLADKGQYLALNQAAPQAFQPRDYTQGLTQVQGQPQGGAQAQLAANQAAQANYKQGAGGVDTGTLKMILSRLG